MARKYKPVELPLRRVPVDLADERARCPVCDDRDSGVIGRLGSSSGVPLRAVPGALLPSLGRAALRLSRLGAVRRPQPLPAAIS